MTDYSKAFDEHDAGEAGANLNGAQGTPSGNAVLAFKAAPRTGVAPSLGMVDPGPQEALAAQRQQSQLLDEVPSLRSFAAQSPAHVAATREDWPNLAKVSVLSDFLAPIQGSFKALVQDLTSPVTPGSNGLFTNLDVRAGETARDVYGLATSPIVGAASVLARPLSVIPRPKVENGRIVGTLTGEEAHAAVTNDLLTALSGLGAGRVRVGSLRPPPIDLGTATVVRDPLLPGPKPPGVNPADTPAYSYVAEVDHARVAQMEEAVAGTEIHGQLPALVEEYLNHTPVKGESAWVDPQAIVDLYAEGHTVLPQFAQQVSEALSAGREVQVPLSAYLADVSGKPYAEGLRAQTRFREDGVSVEEGKTLTEPEAGPTSEFQDSILQPQREVQVPEDVTEHAEPLRTLAAQVDSQVEEVFQEHMLTSLFTDAKALKMNKGQFERYDAMLAEAKAAASERILQRTYDQIRRERTPEWKEAVAREVSAVEGDALQHPGLNAYSELTRGKDLQGAEVPDAPKLNSAFKTEGLPSSAFSSDGLEPDDVAPFYGFGSGQEMLAALATVHEARGDQGLDAYVRAGVMEEATARARTRLGYDVSPGGLAAAVREAAILPQVEDFLEASLRDLAEEAGLPFDKATLKAEAKRQFDLMPVREATRVRQFERGMWSTGQKTQVALEKGDWSKAFRSRQAQLLNFYQLEASHFLTRKLGVTTRKFTKLGKRLSVKGLNQEFLDQLHQYLPRLDIAVKRDLGELLEATGGLTVEDFVASVIHENPVFPGMPPTEGPLTDMQVQDFWRVREFLYALDKYGREVETLKTAEGKAEFEATVQAALGGAPPPNKTPPVRFGGRQGFVEKMVSKAVGYDAAHRKIADIGEYLDSGNPKGVFAEVIENAIEEAASRDGALRRDTYKPVTNAFHAIPSSIRAGYNAIIPEHPFSLPDGTVPEVRRGDIPAIALYVGQESGLTKLAEGYGTIAPEVLAFLDAHITEPEVEFVQGVWDRFEELSVPVSEALRAMTGTGLRREDARAWRTPFGTKRGGYWPVQYDRELDIRIKARDAIRSAQVELDPVGQMFTRVAPDKGFAELRTAYVGPVLVRLSSVADAFDAHIKYAAYAQTVASIRRFINDPRIRGLVTSRMGKEYYDQFNSWLDAVVLDYTIGDRGTRGLQALAHQARLNTTISVLGFSYSTGISQVAGLPGAIGLLSDNPVEGVGRMASALVKMAKLGLTGRIRPEIFDKSEFMAQRFAEVEPNMTEAMSALEGLNYTALKAKENYLAAQRASMAYIGWVEFSTVSGPTWVAAYDKGINSLKMTEGDAVRYADRLVRKSQGSGRRVDLAAVQRGDGFQRWFYMFQTFFNAQYQRGVEVGRFGKEGEYGKAFNLFLWFFVLSPLAAALLTNHGPKDGEPGTLARWASQNVFFNMMRPFFLLGNVTSTVDRNLKAEGGKWVFASNPKDLDFSADPFTRSAAALFDAGYAGAKIVAGDKPRRPVQAFFTAAGLALGIPGATQFGRSGEYLYEITTGDQAPDSVADVYLGLTGGPQKDQATASGRGRRARR